MDTFDLSTVKGVKVESRVPAKAIPLYMLKPGATTQPIPKAIGGISEILLANGEVLNQCDDCGYTGDSVASVIGHRSKKHPKPKPVLLPPMAKRVAVKVYEPKEAGPSNVQRVADAVREANRPLTNHEIAEAAGLEHKKACDALTAAARVGLVHRELRGLYTIPTQRAAIEVAAEPRDVSRDLAQASQMLRAVAEMLDRTVAALADIPEDLDDIRAKAKKFDDLEAILGRR